MIPDNEEKIYIANNLVYSKNNQEFKKNEEPLKDNEGNKISQKEFNRLVKYEVTKFISQSFDNIVVLVGAGASVTDNEFKQNDKGIALSGVTVAKIAKEVSKQLESKKYKFAEEDKVKDVFTLSQLIEKVQYPYKLNDPKFNLEDLISLIINFEKFNKSSKIKFSNSKKAIFDIIIKATSYDYNNNTFKHVRFFKILSNFVKSEHKLNVVTTNYDTLLEDAAESMKVTVFDGFSFSQTPQFDSTMFDWNLVKNVPAVKTHEYIYKSNVINLLKIHGSLTWERSESGNNIVRKNKKLVSKPIMVFPSSDKYAQSYQEPYFELFTKFQELLRQPNTLFITSGFSFADNHISRMILSALQTNESLATLITDFNIEPCLPNKNWTQLFKMMNDHYQIAFLRATMNGTLTDYLGVLDDDNR